MSDFSQKELDAIIRDGVDKHQFAYNEDAWRQMESKLNRQEKRRKTLWFFVAVMIALLSVLIGFNMSSDTERNENVAINQKVKEVTKKLNINEIAEVVELNKVDEENENLKSEVNTTILERTNTTDNELVNLAKEGHTRKNIISSTSQNEASEQLESFSTTDKKINESKSVHEINPIAESAVSENNMGAKDKTLLFTNTYNNTLSITSLKSTLQHFSYEREIISLDNLDLQLVNPHSIQTGGNRFTIKLMGSTEWSTLNLMDKPKAGWRFGSALGYQLKDRFEVSLGIAYSRKQFSGSGTAYNAQNGFWIDDIVPMTMDAKCEIIEIPISLAYYPSGFRNDGFFAELGFSTYRLHSEWYGFTYHESQMRPGLREEHVQEDENAHMLGAARIELGYQKIINKNTTLQAAPYVQLPLGGIGEGKVMLFSAGLQLAVKFNSN